MCTMDANYSRPSCAVHSINTIPRVYHRNERRRSRTACIVVIGQNNTCNYNLLVYNVSQLTTNRRNKYVILSEPQNRPRIRRKIRQLQTGGQWHSRRETLGREVSLMRKEFVFVVGTAPDGSPSMTLHPVNVTDAQYAAGNHFEMAIFDAEELGYKKPFVCFDNTQHDDIIAAGNIIKRLRADGDIENLGVIP